MIGASTFSADNLQVLGTWGCVCRAHPGRDTPSSCRSCLRLSDQGAASKVREVSKATAPAFL
jgi:hypothetical protein